MALAGQIVVPTAGTAVRGPDVSFKGPMLGLKAHPSNTGIIWVGNTANDVDNTNGFPLEPGETIVVRVGNLTEVYFDTSVSGERVCWIQII